VTIHQLRALAEVLKTEDWSKATKALGVGDMHQVIRSVHRLFGAVGVKPLETMGRVKERALLPEEVLARRDELSDALNRLLDVFESLTATAQGSTAERPVHLRLYGYSSMFHPFLAEALRTFAAIPAKKRPAGTGSIEIGLVDLGNMRQGVGGGVFAALQRREVDVAIAPYTPVEPSMVDVAPLYRWYLLAGIEKPHPAHDLVRADVGVLEARRWVDGSAIVRYPLVVAPRGHESREMLREWAPSGTELEIAWETPDTDARAQVFGVADWIPIVASDALAEDRPRWPVVMAKQVGRRAPKGGVNAVYWRTDLPKVVLDNVGALVEVIQETVQEKVKNGGFGMYALDAR
jgi:hypothetical protein